MDKAVFLIELVVVFALAIVWAVWEYRKASALQKKAQEEETAAEREQGEARDGH